MIESNLINYKQAELIHEIISEGSLDESQSAVNGSSLKKYELYEALSKTQNALTNQSKTVNIVDSAFD